MFVYLVHLTNGSSVRVETEGNPVEHPAFAGKVVNVETIGEVGKHLSLV